MDFEEESINTHSSSLNSTDNADHEGTSLAPPAFTLTADPAQLKAPEKNVSGKAMSRLAKAKEAIEHTKSVFSFGAANQTKALKATNMNTAYRLQVQRDDKYWELTPKAEKLAKSDWLAYSAAKAYVTKGGNCDEHARVTYDYLDAQGSGETINYTTSKLMKHAFVIMGDMSTETHQDLVVPDAWPTSPSAVVWEDHMAYSAGMSNSELVKVHQTEKADGKSKRNAIAAGLKLKPEGLALLSKTDSDAETDKRIKDGTGGWIWDHEHSYDEDVDAGTSQQFEYIHILAEKIEFVSGSSKLTTESKASLATVAATMKSEAKLKLTVEGHTDSVGSESSNQELSEKRALSCKKELETLGVNPSQLVSMGYGESDPIADNNTAEGRKKNRRVTFETSLL